MVPPESDSGLYIYFRDAGYTSAENEGRLHLSAGTYSETAFVFTADMFPTPIDTVGGRVFLGWKLQYLSPGASPGAYSYMDVTAGTTIDLTSLEDKTTLYVYAVWGAGIPGQIARITNAVNDIKAAIVEKGGAVPEDAQVDDLADIIRNMSTPQQNLILPCTLTNYEHYYAVGSNSVTVNGGRMTVSTTQTPYVVGYYNRGSSNKYSAVMVTAPAQEISGTIKSITLRLTVTTNNNNAVYVGRVTDTSNLTNTGGMPWHTGSETGYILKDITDLGYAAGCNYSLIQDSNSTSSVDIVVTGAALIIETE